MRPKNSFEFSSNEKAESRTVEENNAEFREGEEIGCLFVNEELQFNLGIVEFPSALCSAARISSVIKGSAKAA